MLQSKFFTKTTKTVSHDIKAVSHKLLYQAGFIRESAAGRYYFLPLGIKARDKIVDVIEQEMNKAGAIKIITPVLHPIELWKETNRTNSVGFELMTVKDRSGSEFALGGTAEEMIVDLVRKFNVSYKDLPFNIYQFSQKFRDELRARGGLLRVREFLMKDAYSFHADEDDFKKEYKNMRNTYVKIFKRLGLETVMVEADNGYIGGDYCHEFVVESEVGESRFLISEDGKYAAHEDVAKFKKENKNLDEKEKKMQEVEAKRSNTMEDGVKLHKLPLWRQIKDVMFVDDKDRFILAVIRGDFDVNETKLKNLIKANNLRHATDKEIKELGSESGFISPVNMNKKAIVVADDSLRTIKNAYGGANKKYRDLLNINIDRDYKPNIEGDIAMAQDGFLSESGSKLKESKGIEVGNIFQLGLHYSEKMNATFTNKNGKEQFYYMGCYGIGVDRTMAAIVEKHYDKAGIIWPEQIAPFKVHLILIESRKQKAASSAGQAESRKKADELYRELQNSEIEVLYDDREEASAGEKFADADLIGCPFRVVVSKKTLANDSVEVKKRGSEKCELVKIDDIAKWLIG
ncbi:MAG: proline--tRNA ligase [Patescibacteria group bacterium]|nr:proline--tRNA ligase [Patescibacteria group bacterium]